MRREHGTAVSGNVNNQCNDGATEEVKNNTKQFAFYEIILL